VGAGPLIAQVRIPAARAASTAVRTFGAAAARRQRDQDVAGPAVRADLPGEHVRVPVVVADGVTAAVSADSATALMQSVHIA